MTVEPRDLASSMLKRVRDRQAEGEGARLEILEALKTTAAGLSNELHLGRVWAIGTVAWGDFGVRSDVDLVLEHGELTAARVEFADRIGAIVGREVDVLVLGQLSASFQRRVLEEGIRVA